MKRLPVLISVPHAGLEVAPEVAALCRLEAAQIRADGDEGAAEIYAPLRKLAAQFITTPIARAIIDLNRAADDFSKDGVIKTHTCWDEPVYRSAPSAEQRQTLLQRYYHPYHQRLSALARTGVYVGIDCHTMVAVAPPVAPDVGQTRPLACIGDAHGACPSLWAEEFAACLSQSLGAEVTLNQPFSGGYITRHHARELPWIQLELSRSDVLSIEEKSRAVNDALRAWCRLRGIR